MATTVNGVSESSLISTTRKREILRRGVKLTEVYTAANGDYIYELALTKEAQDLLFEESKRRGITIEEFLRAAIESYLSTYGVSVDVGEENTIKKENEE